MCAELLELLFKISIGETHGFGRERQVCASELVGSTFGFNIFKAKIINVGGCGLTPSGF